MVNQLRAKDRILQTAVTLFNEQGTAKVSTNHIAASAGMSPGNLYYHFKNKEEIIGAILDQMYTKWHPVWTLPNDNQVTLIDLRSSLLLNFEILWEFRFFYREAIALLQADLGLRQKHQEMMDSRMLEQEAFIKRFVQDGVFYFSQGLDNLPQLVTAGWIVATNWLAFLEMNGVSVDAAHFQEGVDLLLAIFKPYLAHYSEEEHMS
ncbi:TetR/AcrR family transcriptional regulator [Paenibacillus sp. GSMTC-2017]|uniref:TetR/AcrR family transcriptional regulator n=1 Tax=Paenibacillus sp. GSMTC-2017 TaxID=2794350 RepID=UPI001A35EEBB|nr:TetR/AcrR family transcriptional regulator [Paenibacillus sp. GSMTC-2017]MBH5320909.1 TetR/AcrR family transcriptional regulator [Paenibacillus sp. GSMTC-2017]